MASKVLIRLGLVKILTRTSLFCRSKALQRRSSYELPIQNTRFFHRFWNNFIDWYRMAHRDARNLFNSLPFHFVRIGNASTTRSNNTLSINKLVSYRSFGFKDFKDLFRRSTVHHPSNKDLDGLLIICRPLYFVYTVVILILILKVQKLVAK